jgi:hypothetical protein
MNLLNLCSHINEHFLIKYDVPLPHLDGAPLKSRPYTLCLPLWVYNVYYVAFLFSSSNSWAGQ